MQEQPRLISPEYAALNRQLHEERADYGATAGGNANFVAYYARKYGLTTVLDYGCGKGTLKPALAAQAPELVVAEYDPAIPGKEALPAPSPDFLIAFDVMEHIEPDYLTAVLTHMQELRPKYVLLVIDLKPAKKSLPDGRNAHILLKPAKWWRNRLREHFAEEHVEDSPNALLFLGRPL